MQTKKNFKTTLQIIAIIFVTLLSSFAFLNLFKTNKLSALTDEIKFVVGTTSIKQTNASILSNGEYQTPYENSYKEVYTFDPQGKYVLHDGTYYYKDDYTLCDKDGNTGTGDYTHLKIGSTQIQIEGYTYKKDYIHGYNYVSFPDYIKASKASATHILIENYYCKLDIGVNCYKENQTDLSDGADENADIFYVKHNEQFYALTDDNSYISSSLIDYSYNIYKPIFNESGDITGMNPFDYSDTDSIEEITSPLYAKNEDKESAFIPTYYSNNILSNLYIKSTAEDFNKENSKTIELEVGEGVQYYRPIFDDIYADAIEDTVTGNVTQENIPFITLDNYAQKSNLNYGFSINENIQNMYVSIGDVFLENVNNPVNKISDLNISVSLENKYYTEAKNIKIDSPIIQSLPTGGNNYFWFQYFDASNIEAYVGGAASGETEILTHPEGLYTFYFKGYYVNAANKSVEFNCSYKVYLNSNDNNNSYPSFNEEFINTEDYVYSGEMSNKDAFETFFYNFQEDYFPTYSYDASIYDISINKNLNLVLSSKEFEFESLNYYNNYPEGNLKEKEYGLVSEYDGETLSKETLIIAEKYELNLSDIDESLKIDIIEDDTEKPENNFDKVIAYSYTYRYRTDNLRTINYFTSNWGTFQQKVLVLVFLENDSNTSVVKTYKITNKDKVTAGEPLQGVIVGDLIKKERISKTITSNIEDIEFDLNKIDTKDINQVITYSYTSLSNDDAISGTGENAEEVNFSNLETIKNSATTSLTYFKTNSTFSYTTNYMKDVFISTKDETDNQISRTYKDIENSIYSNAETGKIEFEFIYDVVFDDLGVYNIQNRYAQSASSGTNLTGDLNQGLQSHFTVNNNINILKYVDDNNKVNRLYNPNREYKYEKTTNEMVPINYQKFGYTLHVFGIKSYFNKDGKTEFKNDELGIYSDATNAILKAIANGEIADSKLPLSASSKRITLKDDGYPILNVPVTNMSPITFDYFGTYSYNNIIPISKYYKYDFEYDDEGKIYVVGEPTTHYFTKDTFPSDDGYYEIIAEYKYYDYDSIKTGNLESNKRKIFHQVFAFAIDNSSPSLTFEKMVEVVDSANEKHLEWTTFGKDDFTNNSVRVSWAQTTYFQYPVVPNIYKTNFDGIVVGTNGSSETTDFTKVPSSATMEYKVGYYTKDDHNNTIFKALTSDKGEKIYQYKYANSCLYDVPVLEITLDDIVYENIYPTDFLNTKFVEQIENATKVSILIKKRVNQLYITTSSTVSLMNSSNTVETPSTGAIWGSGKYQVRLQYGYQSKSYLTQGFTIDNTALTGLTIKPVDLEGTNKIISLGTFSNNTQNLIKDPFTFIYDKRPSGASIETSYTVIPFASKPVVDKLNLDDSLAGITGTELINSLSSSASVVNHYAYDYSFKEPGDIVYASNIFTPSSSALYIFNLKDSAGNTAEYFVSFDLSAPNFFVETKNEDDFVKEYNIITGLTDVSWGDYKAIEIKPQASKFDDSYIFGSSPNYLATNLEKMMKSIYQNESTKIYSGAKLVRTWTLTDGTIEQIPSEYLNNNNVLDYSKLHYTDISEDGATIRHYYKDEAKNYELVVENGSITTRYFILINIKNVNFQYFNTNSEDTSTFYFDYSIQNGKLAKNSTVLSPTRKALIEYWKNKGVTITEDQILKDSTHTYGFFGEKKYIYVISDILGNEAGNSLWMNLDLTLAMAFGSFTKTNKELSVSTNLPLTNLTPYSPYTASQIYFSWLVDDGNGKNAIPESKIDFKFFNFDLDFYNNYVITGISYNETTSEYMFTFVDSTDETKKRSVVISNKNLNNFNADGDTVSEPVSMYPFELNDTNNWDTIVYSSISDSNPTTMAHDGNRYYSSILNKANESGSGTSYIVSKPGLYLFRRVYVDYIDSNEVVNNANAEEIGDDTIYRYYLYYIDRNGIIDLTAMPNISSLSFLLGAGINEKNYSKEYTEEEINSKLTKASEENISYSSMKVDKLFFTNKAVVQMNLTMDKYNQAYKYQNFLSSDKAYKDTAVNLLSNNLYSYDDNISVRKENAYRSMLGLVNKYVFGINDQLSNTENFDATKYYNDKFLLRLELIFGSSTELIGTKEGKQNLVSPENDGTNRYLLDSLTTRPTITTAKNREELKDGILLTKTNLTPGSEAKTNYTAIIKDSSGITEGSNIEEWNKFANELSITFGITSSYPKGYYFGKYNENQNLYSSTSANADDYAEALFRDITSSLTTNTLQDLNSTTKVKEGTFNHYVASNTNNETLIFYFERTPNDLEAQIEPYEITVTRTLPNQNSQVLFKVTLNNDNPVYSGLTGYTQERLKKALVSDATQTSEANRWAVVVFDNYNGGDYKNLLGNASDNATYEISIQYKGIQEDYSQSNGSDYYFKGIYEVTIDNVKPLYNLIKLMENDKYISNKTHSLALPQGYTNIDDYYEENLAGLSALNQQAALENIYNYYMESYYIKNNGNIEYFKGSNGEDYVTYNGTKIAKTYIQNYFFGVDENFEFKNVNSIDASTFYYREISNIKNYNFSLTKDDFPTTASETTFRNNPLFDPNALDSLGYYKMEIAQSAYLKDLNLETGKYYEIIEKDSAGNYRVYAIFYGKANKIDYTYSLAKNSSFESGNNGTLNQINNAIEIYGTNLNFAVSDEQSNDKFLKAEIWITYSASTYQNIGVNNYKSSKPIIVYLNPIDSKIVVNKNGNTVNIPDNMTGDLSDVNFNEYPQEFLNYITALCNLITSNNKGISDFSLDINLINRFGEEFFIEYNYPGEELKYIKNGYKITIPADSEYRATKIIGLEISRYQNGLFSEIIRDANNKDIINENGGSSLGGTSGVTYTLSNGTYKIVLTDNFGRVSTYYETYDANSVEHSIAYSGATSYIDTDLYTAKTTTITYDPSLYIPVFFITDDVTNKAVFYDDVTLIPTTNYYKVTASSTSTTQTTVGKLTFNQESGHHTKFNVILLRIENLNTSYYNAIADLGDSISLDTYKKVLTTLSVVNHEYSFVLYTKLPTIQLKNLNGGIIANNNNQIFIEDLIVVWNEKYNDGLTFDFNAKLKMRRYHNGTTYSYIITTNNYKISLPGDYFLILTNSLGYESEEIKFTRAEGATILYSVYTKTSDGYSTQLFESSYTTTYNGKIVYHYYALENFKNLNTDGSPVKTKDHIDIVTNTNNKISYSFISEESNLSGQNLQEGEVAHAFYKIYSLSPDGTNEFIFRYIQINFVKKATSDFSNLNLLYLTTNEGSTIANSIAISSNIIKSTKNELILFFNSLGYNQVEGNSITLTHYFNGQFVESIKLEELDSRTISIDGATETLKGFSMSITSGGLHRFELRDLAGNVARFSGYQYINICLINSIVYNINDNEPVDGEIFNGEVILEVFTKLENTTLYEDYTIEVFRNSLEHEYEVYGLHTYRFTQAGYYLVRLSASVQLATNLPNETITTTFSFKIINPQTTVHTFDISSGNNFRVISIEKKIDLNEDTDFVPLPLQSANELWLSAEDSSTGTGLYRITLQAYVASLKQYRTFSFNVWLSSAVPSITASIAYGTATTDPITLTYNEKTIFDSIGESKIVINDVVITNITAESIDSNKTFTITTSGEYWVQILTADDKLVASYKLTKNEPLNSNAKIVIIIVVAVVIILVVIFIIIRRKTRFK